MPKTLLLADDSSTIQRVVELTFAEEDIRVIAVGDGEQAIQSIDREQPDIVLADVGMPRLDGYSVSSHIKQSARLQHIPVLLLAGAFEPIDEDRARAARCDGVLVKPFEPRLLVSRVQELLEAARARQAVAVTRHAHAALGGDGATSTGESAARVVLAWPKLERTDGRDRPAPPSFAVADLDRQLAVLTPPPIGATMPADPTPAVTPPPAALVHDPVGPRCSIMRRPRRPLVAPEPPAAERQRPWTPALMPGARLRPAAVGRRPAATARRPRRWPRPPGRWGRRSRWRWLSPRFSPPSSRRRTRAASRPVSVRAPSRTSCAECS